MSQPPKTRSLRWTIERTLDMGREKPAPMAGSIHTRAYGTGVDEGSDVVGDLGTSLGVPNELMTVREDSRGDGGTVAP